MIMAADSNMSFHNGVFPSSFCNQVVVSFQSGAVNGTAGVVQGGINNSGGISSSSGMVRAGNPSSILNNTSSMMLQGNSQSSLFLEPMAGLKHDTGLAVDWSYKEQAILHHGLIKYADQPSILKYIKIAALLPEKTVRDVALRCRWMSRKESDKRRKLEEFYTGKKLKDRKEKMVNSSSMENIHQGNVAGYPFMMHQVNHNNQLLTEDNADLFLRTRNNITAILNSMSGMPGIMSQMPPLPVTINEDLVTTILPNTSQAFMFNSPTGITVKQEPRC
ncbi:hypothetical protein KFK09_017791 [Dendrobium nobile]|uniref:Uncharacterized protein n=1 Tax=Dendrobium nobile TaxID=94219 RepID=A0A8T3AZF2_DENNO|nr:hypothetical protein KFK09_017791 [Dendrobium nobile]